MPNIPRSLILGTLAVTLAVPAGAGLAQEAIPNSPPELRDFQLRPDPKPVTPDEPLIAPVERPAPAQTQPTVIPPPPPPVTQPAPTSARPTPAEARPQPVRERAAAPTRSEPAMQAPLQTEPVPTIETAPAPLPQAAPIEAPIAAEPAPEAAPEAASPAASENWMLWGGGALALLLTGGFLLLRRRRTGEAVEPFGAVEGAAAPLVQPSPPARPVPAAPATPAAEPRPWLEVEFRPGTASATQEQTVLQFELIVRNRGDLPAHRVRITGQMMNTTPDLNARLSEFYAEDFEPVGAPRTLVPGAEESFKGALAMTREELKVIQIQDRSLFIPLVAVNVLYDWGDGRKGQTAQSYIVGRESDPPAAKMAPFRLDLGPRVYRKVGTRQHDLKRVA
jgi:LPXTG-motif cell wall-anchored protein